MNNNHAEKFNQLRLRAESLLDTPAGSTPAFSTDEIKSLLHDLSVHQIELRLQNEELQRSQTEVEEVRNRYIRLYNQAPVGYLTLDNNGLILQHNQTFSKMCDIADRSIVKKSFADLLTPGEREVFLGRFRPFYNNPEGKVIESHLLSGSGKHLPVRISGSLEQITAGKTPSPSPHLLLVVNDMTAELLAKEATEIANQAKNQFLATVSHELKTPLHGIIGYGDVLSTTELNDDQQFYLSQIQLSSDILLRLIGDLLDISRLDAGMIELELRRFSPRELLNDLILLMTGKAEEKGLTLSCSFDASLPGALEGDPLRIKQIAANLLHNAIKFTRQGGSVALTLTGDRLDDYRYQLQIRVRDTGIGVAPEQQKLIFERFTQADSSMARRYGGSGLGLAICRQLVELMQGEICLEQSNNNGSTFQVSLPLDVVNWDAPDCSRSAASITSLIPPIGSPHLADIDGRSQAAFFSATLDALTAHICVIDQEGRIQAVNKAWRRFCRQNQGEEKSCNKANYLQVCEAAGHANCSAAETFAHGIKEVLTGKRPLFTLEYDCHSPSEQRWFIGRATRFEYDGNVFAVVSHQNITPQIQAERSLDQSEATFKAAFDQALIGMARCDLTGHFLLVNKAFCRITGYTAEELLGSSFFDITLPEDLIDDVNQAHQLLSGEISHGYSMEKRYIHKEGAIIWVNLHVSLVRDQDDLPLYFMGIVEDITDRKHAEAHAQELNLKLEQRLNLLTQPDMEPTDLEFCDLFDLDQLQELQDALAAAFGISSIITDINGNQITRPSNFCRLCRDLIRTTESGRARCISSNAGYFVNKPGDIFISPCHSCGLMDGGAGIFVGERRIAHWVAGQVLDDAIEPEQMLHHADTMGIDREFFQQALQEAPRMSRDKFESICVSIGHIATQLSTLALRNYQQARDIELRIHIEKQLEQANNHYRDILQDAPVMIWRTDSDGAISWLNDTWLQFTGNSLEDELARTRLSGIHPDDAAYCTEIWSTAFNNSSKFTMEYRHLDASGNYRWIADIGCPYTRANGEPAGFIGFCFDISARREDEEALRLAKEAAETANQAKSRFLSNMSHELRTPLNSIIGFTELVHDGVTGPLTKQQQEYTGNVLTSARHLLVIISEILDLSRIEAGKMKLDLSPVSLDSLLLQIRTMFSEEARRKDIRLSVEAGHQAGLTFIADEVKIRQVIINLVANALKFTDLGGAVRICTDVGYHECAAQYGIDQATDQTAYLELSVTDTGIGIKSEDHQKLFQEFSQLDSGVARIHEGTGLGLALSKKLVELHGGQIRVSSESGAGSTFAFILPLTTDMTP